MYFCLKKTLNLIIHEKISTNISILQAHFFEQGKIKCINNKANHLAQGVQR